MPRESRWLKPRRKGSLVDDGMRDKVEGKIKETEGKVTDDELDHALDVIAMTRGGIS